jgi:ACT domain-containing protein
MQSPRFDSKISSPWISRSSILNKHILQVPETLSKTIKVRQHFGKNHAKSIQSFITKIGKYREAKSRSRIGMYKKMHRVTEKEKGESLLRVRGHFFFFATDN